MMGRGYVGVLVGACALCFAACSDDDTVVAGVDGGGDQASDIAPDAAREDETVTGDSEPEPTTEDGNSEAEPEPVAVEPETQGEPATTAEPQTEPEADGQSPIEPDVTEQQAASQLMAALMDGLVVNVDDDVTGEDGSTGHFTVNLAGAPGVEVVLSLTSDNPEEGRAEPSTVTFNDDNWDEPQGIDVYGEDDWIADGDRMYVIEIAVLSADADVDVNDLPTGEVDMTNLDDDVAGVVLQGDEETSEAGGQASIVVELTSEPTGDVTVTLASADPSEGTVVGGELTFTAENWDTPQEVVAEGVDDALFDGDQEYDIVVESVTSDDENYNGLAGEPWVLLNLDDERVGLVITHEQDSSSEAGQQATFRVALSAEPSTDVVVAISSSDESEGVPVVEQVSFTPVNWQAPQVVIIQGVDDSENDGNQVYTITLDPGGSADPAFSAAGVEEVSLLNVDDDSPGFTVSAVDRDTTEGGGQATFSVVLNYPPTADVTLDLASNDQGEGTVSPKRLTFTDVNWAAPQLVTVSGVDDDQVDGDQSFQITFGATSSADTAYAALRAPSVEVVNLDNDTPGFVVEAINPNSSENGGAAAVSIALASQPTASVTLGLSSSDESEGTPQVTSVTFTPVNWNAPQTISVTGVDDSLLDGDQPYMLNFGVAESDDSGYMGLTHANVALINVDNDSPGLLITRAGYSTSESGDNVVFTFALKSKPNAEVSFSIAVGDLTEGSVNVTGLTFTPNDWDVPQDVTVHGVDDDLADGNQVHTLAIGVTQSDDLAQAGIATPAPAITNIDDDSAGIAVSDVSGDTTEDGGTATFTVVLNSEPYENVTVHFDTSDAQEGSPDVTSLSFTPTDWDEPQTVTITGVDDDLADGNQPYAITFSSTTSDDPAYAAITPENIDVANIDDDSADFIISEVSGDTTEDSDTATFSIVLNSQPDGDVVVNVTSSNQDEGTALPAQITFDSENWDQAVTVTITGVDDEELDGDVDYSIQLSVDESTNDTTGYAALDPDDVSLTNLDNESAEAGSVSGTVVNAVNGNPVADVAVAIQGSELSTTTNGSGAFTITDVPAGAQTVTFDATGYSSDSDSITVNSGSNTNMGTVPLNPTLAEGEFRVILTWTPSRDLDIHAFTPGEEHIYWDNTSGTNISLDADDYTCCGPETITITALAAGDYTFHVFNYESVYYTDIEICQTGAQLRVYADAGLIATRDVPTDACEGSDYTWNALTLNNGVVTPIDTFGTSEP